MMVIASVFGRVVRSCGGLWHYLTERVRARTAVELERERNSATANVIMLLPSDAELKEWDTPHGRHREIRMALRPMGTPTVVTFTRDDVTGELPG
ncbi:hypothetical protein AB0D74_11420 [Streptomyces sp. NPDC048278]|uniref:hypothetical protein n=1 Tax=Streptomyces sp. NPDC048278 TaxID=3155809 RepID=UPI00341F8050